MAKEEFETMAVPKRRHSKARTRTRRAAWQTKAPAVSRCPQCHEPRLPHTVCSHCGTYRGRTVVATSEE